MEERLHLLPILHQKLLWSPSGFAVWADDDNFYINNHVSQTSLPCPGNLEEPASLAANLTAQLMTRSKPLWGIVVVDELARKNQFAVMLKVHHCMADGISTVTMMETLCSEKYRGSETVARYKPRPAPALLKNMGMVIMLFSYNGSLIWGITTGPDEACRVRIAGSFNFPWA